MNVRQFPLLHCLSANNNLFRVNHYVIRFKYDKKILPAKSLDLGIKSLYELQFL